MSLGKRRVIDQNHLNKKQQSFGSIHFLYLFVRWFDSRHQHSVAVNKLHKRVADGIPSTSDPNGLHHPGVPELSHAQLPVKELQENTKTRTQRETLNLEVWGLWRTSAGNHKHLVQSSKTSSKQTLVLLKQQRYSFIERSSKKRFSDFDILKISNYLVQSEIWKVGTEK